MTSANKRNRPVRQNRPPKARHDRFAQNLSLPPHQNRNASRGFNPKSRGRG